MKDLETKNLKIRKFKLKDAKDVYENLATEKRLQNCLGYTVHKNLEETKIMINSYINEYNMDELVWAIEEKESASVIGYIKAVEISYTNKICKLKFGIGFKFIDKHYIEEALREVLDYLFKEKNFNIIVSEFYDGCEVISKIKSNVLEAVGMEKEAVLRNRKINHKTGIAENKVIYSIIK